MVLVFRRTRTQRLVSAVGQLRHRALDTLYAPVIRRLTHDEYFACRTRNDCLRTYLRRRLAAA